MSTPARFQLGKKRVFVAGHSGMVGQAVLRRLASIDCDILAVSRQVLDLRNQSAVDAWFDDRRPDVVVLAAGTVGGILANAQRPVDFLLNNILIEANVIAAAQRVGVEKLLFLGSSCIYPKFASQPIGESQLLAGPLEPTNQWYAIAKIAGIKLVEAYQQQYGCDFISAMPTNLYGPGDNFNLESAHVLPALLRRIYEAKLAGAPSVVVWGSGTPIREMLFVDDLADACIFLLEHHTGREFVNVGSGQEFEIHDIARQIAEVVGFGGEIIYDRSKPDGTPRKTLDCGFLSQMGWTARTRFRDGLEATYAWYLDSLKGARPGMVRF